MRVLLISHTCQSPTEGQPKVIALGKRSELQLKVVVPTRWKHYGRWRPLEIHPEAERWLKPMRVVWPWLGPAQFYAHWYPNLRATIEQFQPDVIDLWEEPWGLVSVQASRLRDRIAPEAALISETEQNLDKKLPPPFEWFRSYTLRRADWLVGRSAEAVSVAQRKGYQGPTSVIPNAVDEKSFIPMDRAVCRQALGVEGFVLGYIGRMVEAKGLADLMAALGRLPETINAVLVGDGPDRAALEALSGQLGLSPRVKWLGSRPFSELPPVMNAIDALVLPSRTTASWKEQFGRVLIEAESCGTPAIGSDSGAIPEVIGDNDRVFAERNPAALAACVELLIERGAFAQPQERHALRRRAVHEFSWEAVAKRYMDVYHQAVEQRRNAAGYNRTSPMPPAITQGKA